MNPKLVISAGRIGLSVGLVCSGLVGCSGNKIEQLDIEVKKLKADLIDLRQIQAQQSSDLSTVKTELRQLTGTMEEVQHVSVGKTRELEETLSRLKTRVPPPAGVPEDLLAQDEEKIAALTGPAADTYRNLLNLIRTGDFQGAQSGFQSFVEQNPNTAFSDNGLFWQGIANERLGRMDQAIVAYSEVFQKFPAEDMVAPALYFLSEAFLKSGSKNEAILTLQKCAEEHGRTTYGAKAKARLAELQGSSGKRRGR